MAKASTNELKTTTYEGKYAKQDSINVKNATISVVNKSALTHSDRLWVQTESKDKKKKIQFSITDVMIYALPTVICMTDSQANKLARAVFGKLKRNSPIATDVSFSATQVPLIKCYVGEEDPPELYGGNLRRSAIMARGACYDDTDVFSDTVTNATDLS